MLLTEDVDRLSYSCRAFRVDIWFVKVRRLRVVYAVGC
jgi:hypothetical protein